MYHFQKQGLDQSQFWLLSFSGKKGRTGWIFVVFSPLSLFGVFFLEWVCFADWNSKGRVDFSVPGTGRRVPGSTDLVMAMVAESCSILTELSCVHGQPMQAQEVWLMKKRSGLTLSFWTKPQKQEQTMQGHFCQRGEVLWQLVILFGWTAHDCTTEISLVRD